MKIAFHDNSLNIRGTTVALYDYAFYLREYHNIEPIILHNKSNKTNDVTVIEKFKKEFEVYGYNKNSEIDIILEREKCDAFFMIKSGNRDGVISNYCKNLIMAVSANINKNDIHGDKFFACSKWLGNKLGIDYVPHMINLPNIVTDLRSELNIPKEATVFGRTGGYETFDLKFVKDSIGKVLNKRNDIYFLFQNTEKFINHERVIFLDKNTDLNYKVKFINTSDALLHGRNIGESFGLVCGEFSLKNKPVLTWNGSKERNHIEILGDKALLYNNYNDLMGLLRNFDKNKENNWNCYQNYEPRVVMDRFKKLYLN